MKTKIECQHRYTEASSGVCMLCGKPGSFADGLAEYERRMDFTKSSAPDPLDSILAAASEVAREEMQRLTVFDTFSVYNRMVYALEQAKTSAECIPTINNSAAQVDTLKAVIKQCEGAIKHANRLLEGNK